MVRGLYTAYTGMLNEQRRLDIISNNMANSDTVAYKKQGVVSQSYAEVMAIKIRDLSEASTNRSVGKVSLGVKIGEVYTDYTQGALKTTDNTYDFAINGNGFFGINFIDKNGTEHTYYTRDGIFTLDNEGYLVTDDGNYVLSSDNQKIQIDTNAGEVSVTETGEIYQNSELISNLGLFDFEDYNYLERYGENMYNAVDGATMKTSSATILQGFTEASNINTVSEMVDLINITRAYESSQKVITTIDSTLEKVVNDIARV